MKECVLGKGFQKSIKPKRNQLFDQIRVLRDDIICVTLCGRIPLCCTCVSLKPSKLPARHLSVRTFQMEKALADWHTVSAIKKLCKYLSCNGKTALPLPLLWLPYNSATAMAVCLEFLQTIQDACPLSEHNTSAMFLQSLFFIEIRNREQWRFVRSRFRVSRWLLVILMWEALRLIFYRTEESDVTKH